MLLAISSSMSNCFKIYKGDTVYELFGSDEKKLKNAKRMLTKTFIISEQEIDKENLIIE